MPFSAKGKTALITGAASGIALACAKGMAAAGANRLILVDRDRAALEALTLPCDVTTIAGDVADPDLWARLEADHAGLDLAVCSAGIADTAPIAEMDYAQWRNVMSVNLDGLFLSLRCAMRLAREPASIVLVSSVMASKVEIGTAAYGASKAGVSQLARVAAKEGAQRGIRVNAIAPGGVDTPIWDKQPWFAQLVAKHDGDRAAAIAALGAMASDQGRMATMDEIAAQILFLLSEDAATISGAVLTSDSGYSL